MSISTLESRSSRAPEVSAEYPTQRYFCGTDGELTVTSRNKAWDTFAEVRVYRDGTQDLAQLKVRIAALVINAGVEVEARFTPEQLREIAVRLLDAAADIEKHPAAKLAEAA